MSPGEFCREIETYLCRKNDGHLIRIVGPVFQKVCGWAAQGVPIKIAYRGIDRYLERQQAKGPADRGGGRFVSNSAKPISWMRSTNGAGRSASPRARPRRAPRRHRRRGCRRRRGAAPTCGAGERAADAGEAHAHAKRKPGLQTHIDRVMARLTQRRMDSGPKLGEVIDRVLGELDTMRASARGARSDARAAVIDRLTAIDRDLMTAAREALDASALDDLRREAARELEPFRSRMPADAFRETSEAALERLIRERWRLPSLRPDA